MAIKAVVIVIPYIRLQVKLVFLKHAIHIEGYPVRAEQVRF